MGVLLEKMKHHILTGDDRNRHSSIPSIEQLSPNSKSTISVTSIILQSVATDDGQINSGSIDNIQNKKKSNDRERVLIPNKPAHNQVPSNTEISFSNLKDLMDMDFNPFEPLKRAIVPDADDFFDVSITLAGSPSNFTVQPYFEGKSLDSLQIQMNNFYDNIENHYNKGALNAAHLSKGYFFAGRHDDGQWYRVKVNS